MHKHSKTARVPEAEELPGEAAPWGSWAQPSEVDTFDEFVRRFWNKELSEDEFRLFRLQNGVYGQSQPDMQMVRVKIPAGGLTSNQLELLAKLAAKTPRGVAHITTRQNVQFHFVRLESAKEMLEQLNACGLTTREACANTVRNITACHKAGVCLGEAFDVGPYAAAAAHFFLRNKMNQNLPRKFKISFSGCPSDCALPLIHDIGAVAAVRRKDGAAERGFEIYVGGGLGAQPKSARLLEPFTDADQLLPTMAAIIRVFDRHGNREQKAVSRMKYLVERMGWEPFQSQVLKERDRLLLVLGGKWPRIDLWTEQPPVAREQSPNGPEPPDGSVEQAEYARWLSANVVPQKQHGFALVHVRLELGDITAKQLETLARVARKYACGFVRTSIHQNLALRWVERGALADVHRALQPAGLAKPSAERLADVTSCPGADTCQLGITSSRGMARRLTWRLNDGPPRIADLAGVKVKISGCPNSCGQHHLASIGLFGGARTLDGRQSPTYQMMLATGAAFSKAFMKIPAVNVPDVVAHIVELFEGQRLAGEEFAAFIQRYGFEKLKAELASYGELAPFDRRPELYRDVGTSMEEVGGKESFAVKTGKGECGV